VLTPDDQVPYSDPIRGELNALESSIEWSSAVAPGLWFRSDELMDPLGRALDAVEASIEGATVRPAEPIPVEPLPLAHEPPGLVSQGASEGPPLEPEHRRLDWISLNPPVAARPFFTHEGLDAPPYQPRGHSGTGIRNEAGSRARQCPKDDHTVDETEDCPSCKEFGDHDRDGVERCYFDWLEENQEQDGANGGEEE
jgi:hypothetical protein